MRVHVKCLAQPWYKAGIITRRYDYGHNVATAPSEEPDPEGEPSGSLSFQIAMGDAGAVSVAVLVWTKHRVCKTGEGIENREVGPPSPTDGPSPSNPGSDSRSHRAAGSPSASS